MHQADLRPRRVKPAVVRITKLASRRVSAAALVASRPRRRRVAATAARTRLDRPGHDAPLAAATTRRRPRRRPRGRAGRRRRGARRRPRRRADRPPADARLPHRGRLAGQGESGLDVGCLQQALIREGYLTGEISGDYDATTANAVHDLQEEQHLFVDGVTGRETALFLNIWRDEQANVVRTPRRRRTRSTDGVELSPVASTGDDAPPLPPDSGSGRRVVYSREGQRVWAVADDGTIIRVWLVTGSKYNNEMPGIHEVYSRSEQSTAWNGRRSCR